MLLQFLLVILILGFGVYLSVRTNKLTEAGALTGGILGFCIFLGGGFTGLIMLATFFILGSAVSSYKIKYKTSLGLAEENKGQRKAGQVLANGGVAALAGLLAWLFPANATVFQLMLAAAFAAAISDTFSSELGNIHGRRYFDILTFKPGIKGQNGVISSEGTLFGFLGSSLIAIIYGFGFNWDWAVIWVIFGGLIGNLADSVLGATLERKGVLNNDAVNFLNTLVGALVAGLFYILT